MPDDTHDVYIFADSKWKNRLFAICLVVQRDGCSNNKNREMKLLRKKKSLLREREGEERCICGEEGEREGGGLLRSG